MPTLINRVKTAAATFATQLGEPLATNLQQFAADWQNSRDAQQQQMGIVGDNRTGRTSAETDLQIALLFALHTIATMFPGDVQQCSSFFDFSLLYPQAHPHKTETLTGTVIKNTSVVALNRSFTDKSHLRLTNDSDNASLLAYLGATADAPSDGKGVEVDAGKSRNLKLSELGDDTDTFLLIKNLSDVNDSGYTLEVKN